MTPETVGLVATREASARLARRLRAASGRLLALHAAGPGRDALAQLPCVLAVEINASSDHPLTFARDRAILSSGHLRAAPLAAAPDLACLATTSLGSIARSAEPTAWPTRSPRGCPRSWRRSRDRSRAW